MNRKDRRTVKFHHGMTKAARSRITRNSRKRRTGGVR